MSALGEFDLIERWFRRPQDQQRGLVALGSGDDCALLNSPAGIQWAVSTDTLVEGRHFLSTVAPRALGHKCLAVNLSDLAACGAQAQACTLNLTLPRVDADWLDAFSAGFFALADAHDLVLCGGDTTAGPLSITVTVMGTVGAGQALRRNGARIGDDLWVSHPLGGGLGEARAALEVFRGTLRLSDDAFQQARMRMEWPQPRMALGRQLVGLAHAAIDLSDGLIGDLRHVLRASGCGAVLDLREWAVSPCLAQATLEQRRTFLLAGGDDYELLWAAAPESEAALRRLADRLQLGISRVGRCTDTPGVQILDFDGRPLMAADGPQGFDHFR